MGGSIFLSEKEKPISGVSMAKYIYKTSQFNLSSSWFSLKLTGLDSRSTLTPFEIAETILAYSVGRLVTKAYMRTDFLEQLRISLELWLSFISE